MSNEFERIIAYLDHEMSSVEREQFETELASNSALKEEVEFYRNLVAGIESEGQEELKEYIRSRVSEESTETETNLWVYAAATVTILMVGYVAIYQYTKTGSFQPAKDFISLSKKSGEKAKFWKKSTNKNTNSDTTTSYYSEADSSIPAVIAENQIFPADALEMKVNDNLEVGVEYDGVSTGSAITNEDNTREPASAAPEVASTQKSADVRMKKSSSDASFSKEKTKAELPSSTSLNSGEVHFVRKISLVSVQLNSGSNESSNTYNPNLNQQSQRFVLNFFEQDNGSKTRISSLKIFKSKSAIYLDLYNLSGENPLIYHVDADYYLEVGPNQIYKLPAVIPSDIANPSPIKNKQIIKLIQDSDQQ
jgi:hypothetical protein